MQESSTENSLLTERERQGIKEAAFNFVLKEMQNNQRVEKKTRKQHKRKSRSEEESLAMQTQSTEKPHLPSATELLDSMFAIAGLEATQDSKENMADTSKSKTT